MAHVCGCYFISPSPHTWAPPVRHYLPQVSLKAHATILTTASRTTLTQIFANPTSNKGVKEIRYTFPLYDGVSVVGFVCRIGDRVITGKVQEKEQARITYNDAVSRGETAGLLEQLPDASDVFTTSLGNVPPGATIFVDITHVGELKHDAEVDGIRFTIPTTIAPRYGSVSGELCKPDTAISQKQGFDVVVDAELPDGSFIRELRSPSHPIAVSMGATSIAPDADPVMNRASATLSLGTAELDRDFVLQIVAKETEIPKAILETHPTIPGQRALMATLVPKFALKPDRPEIVFICDRSGSMDGTKIQTLINALKIFLKSLPTGVKFNICSFGSHYSFLWERSKSYSQATLEEAMRHVQSFSANFGGTEMFEPLKQTLSRRYKDMSLEVFLVTDGQIWNQQTLFQHLNQEIIEKKAPIRVFTLGIGTSVSHALIEGIARSGNGFAQSVGENEKLDSKIVRMLKAGLSPHINDYSLEVKYADEDDEFDFVEKVADSMKTKADTSNHGTGASKEETPRKPISLFDTSADPDATDKGTQSKDRYAHLPTVMEPKFLQAPHHIPPLFPFIRTSAYILISPVTPQKIPTSVILRATSLQGPLELEIPIHVLTTPGQTVHQLAARKAILELEEGRGWLHTVTDTDGKLLKERFEGQFSDIAEREAVRLGVRFQVQSKWTSFVAVNEKERRKVAQEVAPGEEACEEDDSDVAFSLDFDGYLTDSSPQGYQVPAPAPKPSTLATSGVAMQAFGGAAPVTRGRKGKLGSMTSGGGLRASAASASSLFGGAPGGSVPPPPPPAASTLFGAALGGSVASPPPPAMSTYDPTIEDSMDFDASVHKAVHCASEQLHTASKKSKAINPFHSFVSMFSSTSTAPHRIQQQQQQAQLQHTQSDRLSIPQKRSSALW